MIRTEVTRGVALPEPVTTAIGGLALGTLASYLANRVDDAQRPLLQLITARLQHSGAELPPNHDVEQACRNALRQAIELMAQAMDLQVVEPQNLLQAVKNRYDSGGNWKPLFDRWHTDEGNWLREFLSEVRSDSLGRFDLKPISDAASLGRAVRSDPDEALQQHFSAAMLDWSERRVQTGKQPAFFPEWVTEGWPLAADMPSVRVTLYQAWCLFLDNASRNRFVDWSCMSFAELHCFTPCSLCRFHCPRPCECTTECPRPRLVFQVGKDRGGDYRPDFCRVWRAESICRGRRWRLYIARRQEVHRARRL
ncbi:MAG: hypothetical protein O3C40_19775 [Planctomycetota bacterium]|nr:hypothetical protein [Planctomycetota bacterium]